MPTTVSATIRRLVSTALDEARQSPWGGARMLLDLWQRQWRTHESRFHPSRSLDVPPVAVRQLPHALGPPLPEDVASVLDSEMGDVNRAFAVRNAECGILPFATNYAMDRASCEALYSLCRILKPASVLETGVANGASSWYILWALHANRRGMLYSVDYPVSPVSVNPGEMGRIGCLVPESLRGRWQLILDDSRRGLKRLLSGELILDMFLHDSEHTYRRMMTEYDMAWTSLRSGGLLMSDDIGSNSAFEEFIGGHRDVAAVAAVGRTGSLKKA